MIGIVARFAPQTYDRQIVLQCAANIGGRGSLAAVQAELSASGPLDYVIVGDHMPIVVPEEI